MADKPGVSPLRVPTTVIDQVILHLPSGRARGTLLTNYELIRSTYTAGAAKGWILFFEAFGAGALMPALAALMRALRAVMLDKDDLGINFRPLGIGEAERRCGCACVATYRKKTWNDFYTSELPDIKRQRLERLRTLQDKVDLLKGAVASTASRDPHAASTARLALADAVSALDIATAPPNFPVQLCYAPNGVEIAAHVLEGWSAIAPDDDITACDTFNMYNEGEREPTFDCLHEHDPECKPVYRMLYGFEAAIFLDRSETGSIVRLSLGEVCSRAARLGVGDLDLVNATDPDFSLAQHLRDDDLPPIFSAIVLAGGAVLEAVVFIMLVSTRGWHQGCALATNGACLPYHCTLANLQLDHPTIRTICFGDDTYGGDHGSRLYRWLAIKETRCESLGHRARRDKESCFSFNSDLEHAPADLPGSPRHPDGRLEGFKGVGCYFGIDRFVRRQLRAKGEKLLGPLDRVDAMRDSADVENSAQIKNAIINYCAKGIPNHWLRTQRPIHTTIAGPPRPTDGDNVPSFVATFDDRTAFSFLRSIDGFISPSHLQSLAVAQARLPIALGGGGILDTTNLAPVAYVASRLATWPRMQQWFPIFADVDILTDDRPWCAEVRTWYADICQRGQVVRSLYREYAKDLSHYCDGSTVRQRFRPANLAPASALLPLHELVGGTSTNKKPSQRQLASVVHHEAWVRCWNSASALDDHMESNGAAVRRRRESTRIIDTSQPHAGAFLRMLPTSPAARIRTDEWIWSLQRRFGLYVSAAAPTFNDLAAVGVSDYDPLGDYLTNENLTCKSLPHDSALRVWHDAHQATACHPVIMGDKENPEAYLIYNEDHIVDLAEQGMGAGGHDFCMELKVYSSLVKRGCHPSAETSFRGDTHAFGNTEEFLIRDTHGVNARAGNTPFGNATGKGAVAAHKGAYNDAENVKHNTVHLRLHNVFSGFAPQADKDLHNLAKRGIDRTEYESWSASSFVPYWAQRISAAIVTADARRCLRRLPALRGVVTRHKQDRARAATRAPPPPTPPPAAAPRE